jgi:hypothetical protein
MTISAVTDHADRGVARLIEQFKGRPRLEAWIRSYLDEVQELSTAAWGVLLARLIDDATGVHLTTIGRIVGQARTNEDDDRFRVLIRTRIAVNMSEGHWDELLAIATMLLTDEVDFTLQEFLPGAMVLTIEDQIGFIPRLEHRMLEEATAGGVRIDVHFHETPSDELFRYGDGPGWGSGVWAGAVSDHGVE